MQWLQQLELRWLPKPSPPALESGRDAELERKARMLLGEAGAPRIAQLVQVVWNERMRSAAGRADYRTSCVTLNPRLHAFGAEEIDRTLRHELAHLLAQARAGRRRISPHGAEWQLACADLGIAGEARCHTLGLPVQRRARRYRYECPACARTFPRTQPLKRASACLACCRARNGGKYDRRFRLRLVTDARESMLAADSPTAA